MNEPKLKVFVRGGGSPPAYANPGDSGLDLRSPVDVELQPGETVKIDTGVHVSIPYGFEGQVRPRSSFNVRGIHVPLGTIDSGYRGSIGVVLRLLSGDGPIQIKAGDRIAQLVIAPVACCQVVTVSSPDELGETERGRGGFGSTGR